LQAGAWRRLTVKRCGRGFVLSLANNEEYIKEKKRKKKLGYQPFHLWHCQKTRRRLGNHNADMANGSTH
jgi:hypothetical protein